MTIVIHLMIEIIIEIVQETKVSDLFVLEQTREQGPLSPPMEIEVKSQRGPLIPGWELSGNVDLQCAMSVQLGIFFIKIHQLNLQNQINFTRTLKQSYTRINL